MVPRNTIDVKEKKTIRVRTTKSEKKRITAVLTCTASGQMLPPMVIFKGTTPRCVKGVSGTSGGIVSFQQKAWVDEQQMLKWIREVWVKHTKKQPSLLVLDACSAHLTTSSKGIQQEQHHSPGYSWRLHFEFAASRCQYKQTLEGSVTPIFLFKALLSNLGCYNELKSI